MRIYVVEDEENIRKEVLLLLTRYGYDVAACVEFDKVIEDVAQQKPDLILLDIQLPYKDGFQICREIRKKFEIPVIMLTAQDSEMEEVMSLKCGADDFVGKPYHPQVLIAHIEAVLKRASGRNDNKITCHGVILDFAGGVLRYQGQDRELTRNELKILGLLMRQPGSIVSRDEIMEELWQDGQFVDENTLNVNIVRLRKKLTEMGLENFLETKRGMGYRV